MGFLRIFRIGLTTGIRNKRRTVPMIILFTILSSLIIYQLARVDSYNTDSLLYTRGIVVQPTSTLTAKSAQTKIDALYNDVDNYIQAVFVVYYLELIPNQVGIISVKAYNGKSGGFDWRWVVEETKPTKIIEGRHIEKSGEVIINSHFRISISGYGGTVYSHSKFVLGDKLKISRNGREISLTVVGLYNSTKLGFQQLAGDTPSLMVVSWGDFEKIVTDIWSGGVSKVEDATYVYVKRIIFIAKGDFFAGDVSKNLESAKNELTTLIATDPTLQIVDIQNIDPSRFKADLTWSLITIIISIVLSFIYAFIIVRFKGKDIATLRAIGWRKRDVLLYSFGEFFLIIIIGYILSILGIYLYKILTGVSMYISLLTYIASLGIVLLGILFGYIIVSRRVSKIPPIKAFKEA